LEAQQEIALTMKHLFLIVTILFSFTGFAQETQIKFTADVDKSKIEWTGKKLTGEHYGEIKLSSGELTLQNGRLASGKFEMDMTSITCTDITDAKSNKRLVDHLKSEDFFAVNSNPRSLFTIKSIRNKSPNEYEVTGDLTIKGKTHPVTFPVHLTNTNNVLQANGSLTFDRSKYDVRFGSQSFYENLGDKLVYDDVDITINLVLSREGSK
jgi:polyisoprenoid-binding protein YceI